MTDKVKVYCLECGKKFAVNPKKIDIECPKCHGTDIEVR